MLSFGFFLYREEVDHEYVIVHFIIRCRWTCVAYRHGYYAIYQKMRGKCADMTCESAKKSAQFANKTGVADNSVRTAIIFG